ncbi:MAG: hypothetical protein KIT10_01785 [Flavobacteriales bacterium]|nr:hypothetical protein [Flavobacteriales bacterium]
MRTNDFLKHLILGALLLTTGKVAGQVTTANNVANAGTDFLGWDNTFPANNFPLRVRHDLNQPIEFYTHNIQRMRLNHTVTYTLGSFATPAADGYLGLSPNNSLWPTNKGPFSRLHLHDGSSSPLEQVYRPWMDNGITFTGNRDQRSVGAIRPRPNAPC